MEQRLNELFERAREQLGNLDFEACQVLREDIRLQLLYPGEYVAFVDLWKSYNETQRLVREVIIHSLSAAEISLRTRNISNVQMRKVEPVDIDAVNL